MDNVHKHNHWINIYTSHKLFKNCLFICDLLHNLYLCNIWQFVAMVIQNCVISKFSTHHYISCLCIQGNVSVMRRDMWQLVLTAIGQETILHVFTRAQWVPHGIHIHAERNDMRKTQSFVRSHQILLHLSTSSFTHSSSDKPHFLFFFFF